MTKRNIELEKLALTLAREEKELEAVCESLKGKTEVFQRQIEVKQVELSPWSEKINAAQAGLNVSKSEYDMLSEKVHGLANDLMEARNKLQELRARQGESLGTLLSLKKLRAESIKRADTINRSLAVRDRNL